MGREMGKNLLKHAALWLFLFAVFILAYRYVSTHPH